LHIDYFIVHLEYMTWSLKSICGK